MQHGYSAALVDEVQALIDRGFKEEAHRGLYLEVIDVLKKHNILYETWIEPSATMVHPSNRGGAGINAYNAHLNAALYIKSGFDPRELANAVSFEVCPHEPLRTLQVDFNSKLVSCADGLLAHLNGVERALTVGSSHTASFFKAAGAGCRTTQASLQDDRGALNVDMLGAKSSHLKVAIEKGWKHLMFPWRCEVAWPRLPSLCEKALNATNQMHTAESEFTIMLHVMNEAVTYTTVGRAVDWVACGKVAVASYPPCSGYIDVLVKYVELFSGGTTNVPGKGDQVAPLLHEVDDFQKAHAAQRAIGPTFIKAALSLDLGMHMAARFRTALLKTQLTADKIENGYCSLLKASDIKALEKKIPAVLQVV
jgi:hypothetical protein